jgi:hypothetical protein
MSPVNAIPKRTKAAMSTIRTGLPLLPPRARWSATTFAMNFTFVRRISALVIERPPFG